MTRSKTAGGLATVAAALVLTACGPGQATIIAELTVDGPDGESVNRPLESLEIQLLPYDRDQIFDSLANAAPTPEPAIPPDILAAQEEVAAAQRNWRETEDRWNTLRDTLTSLSEALEGLNRGERQYQQIFIEWQDLDRQYQAVERQVAAAFSNFEELQAATIERVNSIRFIRQDWGDQAFADVGTVMGAKEAAAGLASVTDTTDVQGTIVFDAPPGSYWVHARHELPYDELYWNIPIVVARGEPVQLRLSRDNADVRPIF